MRIVGHGLDLVETARIAQLMRRHGQRFLERCFTEGELRYCSGRRRTAEHLAARFAVKEAVLKALGTGLALGISWSEVEVVRDAAGRPEVVLHGRAREVAQQRGVTDWLVTLSHTHGLAAASAIAVASQGAGSGGA